MRPRVGISACLLGHEVRYDGESKEIRFLSEDLARVVEFVPVCPEVEIGLGAPRPRIDLVAPVSSVPPPGSTAKPWPHMMQEGTDLTPRMLAFAAKRSGELAEVALSAFVFKARSPSCGLAGVKQVHPDGSVREDGAGVFATAFGARVPHVLRFEESAFAEAESRESAVTAIFTLARWHARRSLLAFHERHRYLLLARSESLLLRMDAIAERGSDAAGEAEAAYLDLLLLAMQQVPAREDHLRVLSAIVEELGDPEGRESRERRAAGQHLIERFRVGTASLGEVLADLESLRALGAGAGGAPGPRMSYEDTYFEPHPAELGLLLSLR